MTDREKIIAEIERLKADYVPKVNEEYRDFAKLLLDIVVDSINSLPAEQNEDLEEASDKYANDHTGLCLENDGGLYEDFNKPKRDFIAGANWQKERMMKSAVDATCVVLPPPDVFKVLICQEVTNKFAIGQKVKVIVKEDE